MQKLQHRWTINFGKWIGFSNFCVLAWTRMLRTYKLCNATSIRVFVVYLVRQTNHPTLARSVFFHIYLHIYFYILSSEPVQTDNTRSSLKKPRFFLGHFYFRCLLGKKNPYRAFTARTPHVRLSRLTSIYNR